MGVPWTQCIINGVIRSQIQAHDLSGLVRYLTEASRDSADDSLINHVPVVSGLTLLHHAVREKEQGIVQMLCYMPKGADPNVRSRPAGETALSMALDQQSMGMVQVLMSHGADIDTVDASGEALVLRCVRLGNVMAVRFLIGESTDLEKKDGKGRAALHHLAQAPSATGSNLEMVKLLLSAGSNPDVQDPDGYTPLHLAAMANNAGVINELLLHGANPEIENRAGLMPFHSTKDISCIAALEKVTPASAFLVRPAAQDMNRRQSSPAELAARRRMAAMKDGAAKEVPAVFISFRVRESGLEAKLLKADMAAEGVAAFVCSDVLKNGDDWAEVISKNLSGCKMMVVLATETYGAKVGGCRCGDVSDRLYVAHMLSRRTQGTEIMGTYEELQYAMRHDIPMFIIKMCPKLKEARAAILLEPRQVEQNVWSVGQAVPGAVVRSIVKELAAC
jgi:hypothetical protein